MADFRKWFYALALVAAIAVMTVPASAQAVPFSCTSQAAVTPTVRVEGYTELVGDLLLQCTGGTPTAAGQAVSPVNITIVLNTNITSKITASASAGAFDEALLIIDEPNTPGVNSNRQILNCGASGAPDSNPSSGPGVCGIISDGTPADTYNGVPNAYGTGTCGTSPAPAVGTFGCGRPNVFQGRVGTQFNAGQYNAVTFNGVPIDPPGTSGLVRTLRFTNVRADAEFLQVSSTFAPQTITMSVSTNNSSSIGINISQQTVAYIGHGLVILSNGNGAISSSRMNFVQCESENPSLTSSNSGIASASGSSFGGNSQFGVGNTFAYISFQEGFANAWKPKNISYTLANGTPVSPGGGYIYSVGSVTVPTTDAVQNVPGAIYNSESGFEFPSTATIPAPNPPVGVDSSAVTGSSSPFSDASTGIAGAGVATQGTRLAITLSNVPTGVTVWTQPTLWLYRIGSGLNSITPHSGSSQNSGVMILVNTDAQGDTAINPATTVGSTALTQISNGFAVWEVLFADPSTSEEVDVPLVVSYTSNLSGTANGLPTPNQIAQVTGGFAPFYGGSYSPSPRVPSASLPVPRFVPGTTPLNAFEVGRCACDLLFPFVTNQAGFDTGIAIANTSADPGNVYANPGFAGATQQQGTVTFYYFGVGNNGAAQPAPQTSASVPAGQVLTYDVFSGGGAIGSSTNGLNASAAGFQGYVIAQAQFQYCHGYAFVSALGIGPTGQGVSEGYLGLILDHGSELPRTVQASSENLVH